MMTAEQIRDICKERLGGWGERCVIIPEDTPADLIRAALQYALRGLEEETE
jgi:hypothetical protein